MQAAGYKRCCLGWKWGISFGGQGVILGRVSIVQWGTMRVLTQPCQKGVHAQQRVFLSCVRLWNDGAQQAHHASGPQGVVPRDLRGRQLSRQWADGACLTLRCMR